MMPAAYQVVSVGRSYLNTPFRHMGRRPGIELDCVGMPICICRELGTVAPDFDVEPYTMSADLERFITLCDSYMERTSQVALGALVAIKVKGSRPHVGIVGNYHQEGEYSLIHASNDPTKPKSYHRVLETRLVFNRYFVLAAVFKLPGVAY